MLELAIAYSNGKLYNGCTNIVINNQWHYRADYFSIEKNSKKSLEWFIKFMDIEQNVANGQFREQDLYSASLLKTIYEGDPDLLDDIKRRFNWFYIGIDGLSSNYFITSITSISCDVGTYR